MNKEDLGKKFYKDGKIYEAIAYSDMPTIELISDDERISVVVGSDYSKEFQLIEEQPKEDKKIEKIDTIILSEYFTNDELEAYIFETQVKLNEIIDKVNKL